MAIADDSAGASTDQRPFQGQFLKAWALTGPFAVAPLVGNDIIGKVLRGEHRRGGVVDDHQPPRPHPAARPFHEVQQFVNVPVAGGGLARLEFLVPGIVTKQRYVPIVVNPVQRMVGEHTVDRSLECVEPAGAEAHLGTEFTFGIEGIMLQVAFAIHPAPVGPMLLELRGARVQLLVGKVGGDADAGLVAIRDHPVIFLHVRIGWVGTVAPKQAVVVVITVIVAVDGLDAALGPALELFRADPLTPVAIERAVEPRLQRVPFEQWQADVVVESQMRRSQDR